MITEKQVNALALVHRCRAGRAEDLASQRRRVERVCAELLELEADVKAGLGKSCQEALDAGCDSADVARMAGVSVDEMHGLVAWAHADPSFNRAT